MNDVPQHTLPFNVWLPFNVTTPIGFWTAWIHQTIGHYSAASLSISFDIFIPALMMATSAQLRILRYRFESIYNNIEKESLNNHNSTDNRLKL